MNHPPGERPGEAPVELPVTRVLPDVVRALRERRACVLVAPTGAGKTTRLPPALEDAGLGPVVVLEPRRLAARAAARRVAAERGVRLGGEVGYRVRFDRQAGPRTRITFVTEGLFVRRLQDDPFLEGVGTVVLDEFHERSLDLDLALALVRRVQLEARDDLRLVVTSATLDAAAVAAYLDGAPVVRSEGRLFPVALEHLPPLPSRSGGGQHERGAEHLARGVRAALERSPGDVLAFLPGVGEIRRARALLEDLERTGAARVLELYGDLSPEAQDRALERDPAARRVVLATNVAESSVTVPGVTAVVDSGLVRVLEHDPAVGLDRLRIERVSLASADQRAGRAGREAEGLCLRLWSAAEHRALRPFDRPEVARADLCGAVLQLLAWGERDLARFPWFEAPAAASLEAALSLARALGALDRHGVLTELGRTLVRLPVQPRLGRLLVAGHARGVLPQAAAAAACLAERDPWRRARGPAHERPTRHGGDSDVLERVRALERFERGGPSAAPELEPGAARACLRARDQLERLATEALDPPRVDATAARSGDGLLRALLEAFPDRLARRRPDDPRRGVLVGGRGVRLAAESAVDRGELFLAVELDAGSRAPSGEALVRQASHVERDWVDGGRTRVETVAVWDPELHRVRGLRRELLGGLVLDEREASVDDPAAAEAVLVAAARADLGRALGLERPELAGLLARIECLRRWCPELELPAVDDELLASVLVELAPGCRSFAALARAPVAGAIRGRLDGRQQAALEREAPERLEVPSGSKIRLSYEPGRPPVLAARIQELFGLRETPRVGGGRVPVVMHLLAPNGRPQQVTDDLESFWSKTYFEVRKELRRRYPKHDWPDDPTTAVARRRAGRGRRRSDAP